MPVLTLTAQGFNWTPDIIRAQRTSEDILVSAVASGVADTIEIEPGQVFRGFPRSTDAELDSFRNRLAAVGGRVSMVGGSLDDATPRGTLLTEDEREAFLLPQLRAAHRLGATGLRLPYGQAGSPLLRRVLPVLHELGITLYEEIQGQQTPDSPSVQAALDVFADLDDPMLRVLVDCSMFMPSLPQTYIEVLRSGGVPEELVRRLETEWVAPETHAAVIDLLRSGGVPPQVHTLYMNLIVRFGRSEPSAIRPIMPMVGALHLKFWDLENPEAQVTAPLRALRTELEGFSGTACSEWGGHEWLEGADATDYTRRHLALAGEALI